MERYINTISDGNQKVLTKENYNSKVTPTITSEYDWEVAYSQNVDTYAPTYPIMNEATAFWPANAIQELKIDKSLTCTKMKDFIIDYVNKPEFQEEFLNYSRIHAIPRMKNNIYAKAADYVKNNKLCQPISSTNSFGNNPIVNNSSNNIMEYIKNPFIITATVLAGLGIILLIKHKK